MIDPNNITTVRVDQLTPDSILLTSLLPFETIDDQALKQATFQDLINFINIHSAALQFEVKRMSVTQLYIDNNFDITGLGTNLCLGFAICNGQNGTENLDGRVGIAYGSTQNNIGGFGGSKDAVVVEHTHTVGIPQDGVGVQNINSLVSSNNSDEGFQSFTTDSTGISGTNKNMQPYIVQLYMMKL